MDDEREEEKEKERERKQRETRIERNKEKWRLTPSRSFLIKYNYKGQRECCVSILGVPNFRKCTFECSFSTLFGPVRYFRDIHLILPYTESFTFERDLGKLFQSATFLPRFGGVVAVRHNIERLPTISIIFEDSWK